jgi:hypothetical protein
MKREYTEAEQRKIKAGRCIVAGCGKRPGKRKGGKLKKMCHAHDRQEWAKRHPVKYKYANLKGNARRRRKEFTLSREYFESLVKDTGYVEQTKITPTALSIDRIRNWEGYTDDNVRVTTISYNSIKGTKEEADVECPF